MPRRVKGIKWKHSELEIHRSCGFIFGTAVNYDFGNVEETGLLIAVDEMQDSTRMRYIESFIREHPESIKLTSGANKVFYEVDDNEKESN